MLESPAEAGLNTRFGIFLFVMFSLPSFSHLRPLLLAVGLLLGSGATHAQDTRYVPFPSFKQTMINPPDCLTWREVWEGGWQPCADDAQAQWLKDLRHWRSERRIRIGYDDARYRDPALAWTRSVVLQTQMMVEDRYFYDPVKHRYTVDRYLDDLARRYGGIDAVLIWPDYPNMGIDDRNHLDMIRSLPGGVNGVKAMISDFHRRGVKVLFPMMMWDQGTRDPGKPWPKAFAELLADIGADGINGDTQDGVPLAYSLAAEARNHPLATQPEGIMHDEQLAWNVMSWGQYPFQFVPKVDRFKWLETRHQVHISDRWARDKTDDLQWAFFNGVGWMSWENVWGIWNGITPRDAEATRRMATLSRGVSAFLSSPDWEPYAPMLQWGVFASRWPLNGQSGQSGQTVWTLVNRNEYDTVGRQMTIAAEPGLRYFDLAHGVELQAMGGTLSFSIEARGFGAVLATRGEPDAKLHGLMAQMRQIGGTPLASLSAEWKPLPQRLLEVRPTEPQTLAPEGMVEIPAGEFLFKLHSLVIEGGNGAGVDVAYPWESGGVARRFHEHKLTMKRFFIDRKNVSNAQYKAFLDASGYRPADAHNFLRDWTQREGRPLAYPEGWGDKPVTWVSLEDAQAFAAWAGKRLPHEWEWQYAAQGQDGRAYPWGNTWRDDAVPKPERGRRHPAPADNGAHPLGASPFGVLDLVGNVWQWTSVFEDEHTRAAILRGGSRYQPQDSIWYFPQAYRNDQHGKYLLMAPAKDRSAMIGFRCVVDTP